MQPRRPLVVLAMLALLISTCSTVRAQRSLISSLHSRTLLPAMRWAPTGSLQTQRAQHTATLLPNGEVLATGGFNLQSNGQAVVLQSTELYNPATGRWQPTGNLINARFGHTATLLQNGQVLVTGGGLATAELYNPKTGSWLLTGSMTTARTGATATLLPNGMVLVAGGIMYDATSGLQQFLATAEIYDPQAGQWHMTGSMHEQREEHTATLLHDGSVLVAAGYNQVITPTGSLPMNNFLATTEIYSTLTGQWYSTGSLRTARELHTATLLPSGGVLVASGYGGDNPIGSWQSTAELFDPLTGSWHPAGSLAMARIFHTAALLPDGTVVIACGNNNGTFATAERYIPALNSWQQLDSMTSPRQEHTATLLPNRQLLVAGGEYLSASNEFGYFFTVLSSAELFMVPALPFNLYLSHITA